ncbi:MAG: efflux RND transporter permease subunit [Oligoflexia bacterium]|nr:efflux RND transporter permease subunit [Oligoflexia bacterium]
MWIVRLALRNPYSVAVMSLVLLIMGALSISSMLVDIFPVIDIPVVGVIWYYPGLTAEQMEADVVTINERAFSTSVQGVERIESQSIPGIGNLRVYFQPGTDIGYAVSEITAVCQTILRILPPGITPPVILPFNAANVPVAQMTITSETLSEQTLFDYALNFIRVRLFTIPGLATPAPYGGATREINVDIDPKMAAAKGVSPQDVSNALQASNIIEPAGVARIGKIEYNVLTNSTPLKVEEFGRFPIKIINGREVLLRDVAKIEDSHADQVNAVRINGKRAIYLNILKKADASTLDVVNRARGLLPDIQREAPKGMNLKIDFDQSVFVRGSVKSVFTEAVIAAVLVSLMILVFLGSWRSVVIVCSSIPLSIFACLIGLKLTGNSINIMTLGGLALSIGMLVDDATVEIENINRNRAHSENITAAILRGAHQIALPAIVTTLAICIVFFPIVLLTGPAKFLFTPLSEAVVFSMIASYVLSRTLVPVLASVLLRYTPTEGSREALEPAKGPLGRFGQRFNQGRERFLEILKERYGTLLSVLLRHPLLTLSTFCALFAVSMGLPLFVIGTDFFPAADVGILKLHFRAPTGSRLEETERIITMAEERIRKLIPPSELETINANIGVPTSYNLAFVPTDNSASMDVEVLIALKEGHKPSEVYREKIRRDFPERFPGSVIYFQSGDMVSQVLNFGLAAPIDIQLESRNMGLAYEFGKKLRDKIRTIPGAADVVIRQVLDYPSLKINIDRERAAHVGLTERDAASSLLFALTGSSIVAPSYYINPENNVNYVVMVKVPIKEVSSVPELMNIPLTSPGQSQILQQAGIAATDLYPSSPVQNAGNLSVLEPAVTTSQINHVNVQKVIDVLANVEGRDLGGVVSDIKAAIRSLGQLPEGVKLDFRGQNEVMQESFTKLGLGMILATVLVYLLMVTLFQSWLEPVIIMAAIPGALIGIVWVLALTGTSLNVESLMGAIMAIGISVSNSNLLVNFANDFRVEERADSAVAALEAGKVRLRPVLMTALAMVLGMIPMALGLSEAGEQNTPLGRAVIGGLGFSTFATLFVVPVAYAVMRKGMPTKHEVRKRYLQEEQPFDQELQRELEHDLKDRGTHDATKE